MIELLPMLREPIRTSNHPDIGMAKSRDVQFGKGGTTQQTE